LRDIIAEIESHGAQLVVIGNGWPEQVSAFKDDMGFEFTLLTDPKRLTYRALRTRRSLAAALHPMVFLRTAKLYLRGGRQKGTQGDALQNGGVFLVLRDGSIPYEFVSKFPGHHPKPRAIVDAVKRFAALEDAQDG
jgi:peroxiredoxin